MAGLVALVAGAVAMAAEKGGGRHRQAGMVFVYSMLIMSASGALLNPAGLTQHGVALHDAIKAMPFPVLEIHMSNIAAREQWRAHSIISPAVKATIQGLGWRSYTAGFRALVELVQETSKA